MKRSKPNIIEGSSSSILNQYLPRPLFAVNDINHMNDINHYVLNLKRGDTTNYCYAWLDNGLCPLSHNCQYLHKYPPYWNKAQIMQHLKMLNFMKWLWSYDEEYVSSDICGGCIKCKSNNLTQTASIGVQTMMMEDEQTSD